MNSNWIINRVGLVDFWYYDDEEFYFQDGRMLLRGSNGSGKSVTMQSLIPLLLDGNMRPERLDSFGSRARKMENYLLEEDDEREERTGYLYMELKREESDQYHSFGIGIRARKNKALDSWYFHINDSRRIGRNILLYKDQGGKITLTKKELINKIGDGGKVIDEQKEYAILVNEKLFGFEKQEEYKELIDLLIRLRAPKLSKELKPTIVSEILTASLQALSDDELKPMSDAIEKMDETKLNLNNLKESLASIKQIEKIYNLYNEIVLENKSRLYNKALQEYDEAKEKNNEIIRDLEKLNLYIAEKEEEFLLLENEEKILKEEEQSLNSNDVTKLKESQLFTQNEIEHINKSIDDKKHNVEEKEFKFRSLNREIESRKTDNDYLWKKIEKNFKEMETTISELPFDDFYFMRDELVARKSQDYSFDLHRDTLEKYVRKVKESKLLLERQKKQAEKCDDISKELDNLKENQYLLEKNKKQCEILFSEEKESLIESMYEWERKNTELKLSSELMQMIEREVYDYEEEKNYFDIQNLIVPSKETIQGSINREIASIDNRINEKINIIREKQTEINDWKTQKEAEPFRSEAVVANRKKLKEADIEFLNFYKAIDFNDNLSQMQKNRIEEALSDMGILDALIVSAKDREKISLLDSGFSDKYIFDDINPVANNILDLFIIEEEYNNILTNGKISRALSSIGFEIDKQAATWISGDGAYGIGVIEGRADSGYQSSFIGSIAREKFRLNRINELEKEISKLELEKKELEAKKSNFLHRSDRLTTEWKNFPEMKSMDTALVELRKIRNNLSELAEKIKIKRDELNKNKENLDNITILVRQACAKCYLKERLDIIEEALLNLDNYKDILVELINNHTKYISNISLISINESNLEDLTYDLENIRADIFSYGRKVIELKTKLEHINEQLKLTDYDKIKDRLDFIVSRLNKIPSEKINTNTYKTKKKVRKIV